MDDISLRELAVGRRRFDNGLFRSRCEPKAGLSPRCWGKKANGVGSFSPRPIATGTWRATAQTQTSPVMALP